MHAQNDVLLVLGGLMKSQATKRYSKLLMTYTFIFHFASNYLQSTIQT